MSLLTHSKHAVLPRQWLLLLLWGAVCFLVVEIRFEHQAVLADKWQAWIPVFYLAIMAVAIPIGVVFSDRRICCKLLAAAFCGLAAVGAAGFWLHAKGNPVRGVQRILATITSPPGQLLESGEDDPIAPLLAPISLVGLGAIGAVVSLMEMKQGADARLQQNTQGEHES